MKADNDVPASSYLIAIAIGIAAVAIFPLLMLWAINTVFTLNIEYGFKEWLAAIILWNMFGTKIVPNQLPNRKN